MAGNDWINSYLEAILDVGPGLDDARSSLLLRERARFTPSRYFVEEVITGFDETDLHRSWVKAVTTRSPQERNTRLENMCWRIWNLARQKKQEIDEQWRLYDGFDPILERKLRARIKRNVSCYGRFMPRMVKIPPGMEFNHIVPHDGDIDDTDGNEEHPTSPDPPIWAEIMRFFSNSRQPMILALARPDPKKNITTLVKAFGECRPLRELANLALIMGNRDGIDEMSSTTSSVLLSVLKQFHLPLVELSRLIKHINMHILLLHLANPTPRIIVARRDSNIERT